MRANGPRGGTTTPRRRAASSRGRGRGLRGRNPGRERLARLATEDSRRDKAALAELEGKKGGEKEGEKGGKVPATRMVGHLRVSMHDYCFDYC